MQVTGAAPLVHIYLSRELVYWTDGRKAEAALASLEQLEREKEGRSDAGQTVECTLAKGWAVAVRRRARGELLVPPTAVAGGDEGFVFEFEAPDNNNSSG
jgi:hypothetical protein